MANNNFGTAHWHGAGVTVASFVYDTALTDVTSADGNATKPDHADFSSRWEEAGPRPDALLAVRVHALSTESYAATGLKVRAYGRVAKSGGGWHYRSLPKWGDPTTFEQTPLAAPTFTDADGDIYYPECFFETLGSQEILVVKSAAATGATGTPDLDTAMVQPCNGPA